MQTNNLKEEVKRFPYVVAEELKSLGWKVESPTWQEYKAKGYIK